MNSFDWWVRRLAAVGASLTLIASPLLESTPAGAQWAVQGSGTSGATATQMPAGGTPVAAATETAVTVRWPAATFTNGSAVGGYIISRYDTASGAQAVVGPGCSGIVTSTSCTERSVPSGTWVYTDTPVQGNWIGTASASSAPVIVP